MSTKTSRLSKASKLNFRRVPTGFRRKSTSRSRLLNCSKGTNWASRLFTFSRLVPHTNIQQGLAVATRDLEYVVKCSEELTRHYS